MKSFPLRYFAAVALGICLLVLWRVPMPPASASTYAAALALAFGVGLVTFITWKNARPVESVGQLLQRTELDDSRVKRTR